MIKRWVGTGCANPGPKILTVVAAMLAGGTHIDHVAMLRAGRTGQVLGFKPMAPSTVGTFLQTFTFGHLRQLEAVLSVEHIALPDVLVTNICFVDDEPRAFCTLSGTGQLVEIDWPRPGLKLHFP